MSEHSISFILNGKETEYKGEPTDRLLDALRNTYGLTSVKCGCREGECGACSVIIDGDLINSCLVAMGTMEGCKVMTLEGYRDTERFKCLDRAFAEFSAVQCGFCTPGMIMAAENLLSHKAHPTEAEIRDAMSGNLCRCTGYNAIVRAISNAAKEGDGLW